MTTTRKFRARINRRSIEVGPWDDARWTDADGNPIGGFAFGGTAEVYLDEAFGQRPRLVGDRARGTYRTIVNMSSMQVDDLDFARDRLAAYGHVIAIAEYLADNAETLPVWLAESKALQNMIAGRGIELIPDR